jgi:hypothetical protein
LALFAALDEMGRLQLALNRCDDCKETLSFLRGVASDPEASAFYAVRSAGLTHAKLLVREGLLHDAIIWIDGESSHAIGIGDGPLLAALTCVEAEALSVDGNRTEAGRKLLTAALRGATSIREHAGHYFATCSRVLAQEESPLARLYAGRADAIWRRERNVRAIVEFGSANGPAIEAQDFRAPAFVGPAPLGSAPYRQRTLPLSFLVQSLPL